MFEKNLVQMIQRFKQHQLKRNIKLRINSIKVNQIRKIRLKLKMATLRARLALLFQIS